MSNANENLGSIGWIDLTVENAEEMRDFYSKVIGWKAENVPMGNYFDFNMVNPESGDPKAGICHKQGINKDFPSVWLVYFIVEDIMKSIEEVKSRGGKVIIEPKNMGAQGAFAVIQDPAGAYCALFQQNQA
ncbi:MAG: hypothetical protein Fur0015_14890 [Ignavibacteriales bacterium]